MTVWKFPLAVADKQPVEIPTGAQILHVADQHGVVCLWALVNEESETERRYFSLVGTGHIAPKRGTHIGSAVCYGGSLVWHVFEETVA